MKLTQDNHNADRNVKGVQQLAMTPICPSGQSASLEDLGLLPICPKLPTHPLVHCPYSLSTFSHLVSYLKS